MFGVTQFEVAKSCEQSAVACVAGRHDAVEHIDALLDAFDQIFRCADTHQIARLVLGQTLWRVRHDAQHFVFGFTYAHATHGVPRKVHSHELFQRRLPQTFKHATLHDAKQGVGIVQAHKLILAATRPTQTHFHRLGGLRFGGQFAVGLVGRAFVELHDDVAVERGLNLHAHFG